jgi:hypothetical protein
MDDYVCEAIDIPLNEVADEIHAGRLQYWRRDADGRTWFKRVEPQRPIFGVPAELRGIPADYDAEIDGDEDDEDDDTIEADDSAAAAERVYYTLVCQRADGHDIDPEFGSEVLEAAGRTMDDWNADVQEAIRLQQQIDSFHA